MPTYGLTSTGFVIKPLSVIKAEIEEYQRANMSKNIVQTSDSVVGQLNGIFSSLIAEAWEVLQALNASVNPDSATGQSLDVVSALTGARRLQATKSTVTVTCAGTPGTVLPVGRVLSVETAGDRFASTAEATIGVGGTVDVAFEAEEYGVIAANTDTLTVIETPVTGWDSATNAADADEGRETETDEELRLRRIDLLGAAGDAVLEAIRAEVLSVTGVTEAYVFHNDDDVTDADGLPPHSFAVVVRGGDGTDILQAIFNSGGAGIFTHGSTAGQVTDSQGIVHNVKFSRPEEIVLSLEVTIERDTDDGFDDVASVALIQASLASYVDTFTIGQDAVRSKLFDAVFRDYAQTTKPTIAGIIDVTQIRLKEGAGAFGTANIAADLGLQLITLDSANVTVILTP